MKTAAASLSMVGVAVAFLALASLHVLSPEFAPSWRVISEYALGRHGWVLSVMFLSWAVATWALSVSLWSQVTTRAGRIGVILLSVSGAGAALASVFEIPHPLHNVAGTIGLLGPIAVVIVSVSLSRTPAWLPMRKPLLWLANINWIAVVLLFASLAVLAITYKRAGGDMASPPKELPPGAIGVIGYANRLSVLANFVWISTVAWYAARLRNEVPIA